MSVYAIVLAAGEGRRMGLEQPKQLLELMGKPVLVHTLEAFDRAGSVDRVVLVAPPDVVDHYRDEIVRPFGIRKVEAVVSGGAERQDSVREGLGSLGDDAEVVAIHDAARPLIRPEEIDVVVADARASGAAVLGTPVTDTVKEVSGGEVRKTLDRSVLWQVQTPQAFLVSVIREAHLQAAREGFLGTDDTVLVERLGRPVRVVAGRADNLKITTPDDMRVAEQILQRRSPTGEAEMRIGQGYDVHRLVEGRALILGGVEIPFEKGLDGHSDADVLSHAVTDAVLGALGQGDIGRHFPDSDPTYKGISSLVLLERVAELVSASGHRVVNVDATVMAQRPKLAPHIPEMQANIATALGIGPDQVSVKATTTEGLGFVGREEGMAAQAVASVKPRG